ncbi:MAG: hypothetical protein GXY36_17705 [Chloroflexi bacterium]|nr:hypothetical protein [Chloroflexota bacterium]
MGSLVPQLKIMSGPVLKSLAPALARLGLVLLGVILGLVWAYLLAPVKFYDAEPVHLAEGYKDQWIKMTAVELNMTGDRAEAARKVVAGGVTPGMIEGLIVENQAADPGLTGQLQVLLEVARENEAASADQAEAIERSALSEALGPLTCIVGTAVIGLILALVMTFYWAVPVGKWSKKTQARAAPGGAVAGGAASASVQTEWAAAHRAAAGQRTDFAAVGEAPPVSQHMSTYILGNDLYDDSFSIETASGEFLGECGSGISETIGVGDPKKVTAIEVWLFDKNDIRTVTKVLMTEHAFNDQALRTKLAPKGDAVLVTPGGITTLETQTLRVQVRIVDLQYGTGPLPPNSFFERLTVELAAWPKEATEGTLPPAGTSSSAFGDTTELLNY